MSEPSRFPPTRLSVVAATHSDDPAARQLGWDTLVRGYWRPVYKHLRLRWHLDPVTAEDATQEFFARAMDKDFFAGFDGTRARFRTFLRVCLDRFAHDLHTAARAMKRGGGAAPLPLDFATAEGELSHLEPPAPEDIDSWFHREWLRDLFAQALGDLERAAAAAGKQTQFRAFVRYDVEAPERSERLTYTDLAREFDVPATQITNWLFAMRGQLRQALLARLRPLCTDDAEFAAEARALFGP